MILSRSQRKLVFARNHIRMTLSHATIELSAGTIEYEDTGGDGPPVQLIAADGAPRVGRIVLVSCDAFDNFPPGLTGKTLVLTGKLPPSLFGLFMQQMRLRPVRRLPIAFGWLTRRGG